MSDPKPLSMELKLSRPEVALAMLRDLARRITSGEVSVIAVTERTEERDLGRTLEITYVEVKGTKQ